MCIYIYIHVSASSIFAYKNTVNQGPMDLYNALCILCSFFKGCFMNLSMATLNFYLVGHIKIFRRMCTTSLSFPTKYTLPPEILV